MGSQVEIQMARTESGRKIRHTEEEVLKALRLLAENGGRQKPTVAQLAEEGINVGREQLRKWRDQSFPRLYIKAQGELGQRLGEGIAGSAMERAMEADQAEAQYIAKAVEKIDEVDPNHLAKNALALANAKGQNIEKAQLLRSMPSQIVKVDLSESIALLERLGVAEVVAD